MFKENLFKIEYDNDLGFKDFEKFKEIINTKKEYLRKILSDKRSVKMARENNKNVTEFYIIHPSTKNNDKYQLTYFSKSKPLSDNSYNDLEEIIDRLTLEGMGYCIEYRKQ